MEKEEVAIVEEPDGIEIRKEYSEEMEPKYDCPEVDVEGKGDQVAEGGEGSLQEGEAYIDVVHVEEEDDQEVKNPEDLEGFVEQHQQNDCGEGAESNPELSEPPPARELPVTAPIGAFTPYIVELRGLHSDCTPERVVNFFARSDNGAPVNVVFGIDGVLLLRRPDGSCTGYGLALFMTKEDADKAVDKHLQLICLRHIHVQHATLEQCRQIFEREGMSYPIRNRLIAISKEYIRLRGMPSVATFYDVLAFLGNNSNYMNFDGPHFMGPFGLLPEGEALLRMKTQMHAYHVHIVKNNEFMVSENFACHVQVQMCCPDFSDQVQIFNAGGQAGYHPHSMGMPPTVFPLIPYIGPLPDIHQYFVQEVYLQFHSLAPVAQHHLHNYVQMHNNGQYQTFTHFQGVLPMPSSGPQQATGQYAWGSANFHPPQYHRSQATASAPQSADSQNKLQVYPPEQLLSPFESFFAECPGCLPAPIPQSFRSWLLSMYPLESTRDLPPPVMLQVAAMPLDVTVDEIAQLFSPEIQVSNENVFIMTTETHAEALISFPNLIEALAGIRAAKEHPMRGEQLSFKIRKPYSESRI